MRTPPNALNVFGTTGAIGTPRTAGSIALAELNRNRLARGIAPAAARPNAKNLRVENLSGVTARPAADVRFGSKADIGARPINVRFTPESGHRNRPVVTPAV